MDFSCHTWAFNDLTLPEALGTIARLGFRYVDIGSGAHLNPARLIRDSIRNALVQEFQQDLATFNLEVADLYLMLPRISINDAEKREADISSFKAALPLARAIRARGITISPGLIHSKEDPEAQHRAIAALREMYQAASAANIPLSIEPHMDSMAQSPEQALYLADAVPGLQFTLDWAHLTCMGASHETIASLLPRARHVQIRPAAKEKLQLPLGDGDIDMKQFMDTLYATNYKGIVTIEYMKTRGWHGLVEVNSIIECSSLRDLLRNTRDSRKN